MANTRERIRRCLSLLRRLQQGPATREELIAHVRQELGADLYDPERSSPKAVESQFSKDIQFLRETMEVDIPSVDRERWTYELRGFGGFRPLALDEVELEAFALLLHTFPADGLQGRGVRALLEHVLGLVGETQAERLRRRESPLRVPLRMAEAETVAPRVYERVRRALRERRALRFAYRAPGQSDGKPRIHTLWPEGLTLDPARGHLYLVGYWRKSKGPYGSHPQNRWQRFRADRILDDEHLQVLPEKLPPTLPPKPRYRLEYWLSPVIAGQGQVTRHFHAMEIHERDAEGWVRITGYTEDLFAAVRLLLSYGPNCRVTGGPEARREMEKLVRGLAEVYGGSSES